MKSRLLMTLMVLAALVGSAAAQDAGNPDSLVAEFSFVPPNADSITAGQDSVIVELFGVCDFDLTGVSSGWKWNTSMLVLDSAALTADFETAFPGNNFKYYKISVDSSNHYRRFQCGGLRFSPGGLAAGRPKFGTWWFHLTGVPDSVEIDTTSSPGLNFVVNFSQEFVPRINAPLVQRYNGTSVSPIGDGSLPTSFELEQNYPNPFNPSTTIHFSIPERAHVTLAVFNVLGQKVATLVDEELGPDKYQEVWYGNSDSGAKVASGIYFYRLSTGNMVETKKMMLLK